MDYQGYEAIRFERVGHVLTVTFDNPRSEANMVDAEFQAEVARLFRDLREEREARAVVLTGARQTFIGGPVPSMTKALRDVSILADMTRERKQMMWDLLDIEVPLIAALSGDAIGGAAVIALFCDLIFMAEDVIVQHAHTRGGLVAGDGAMIIWPIVLGPALAKRYLLTGDPISAEEALRLGLVTHVSPRNRVLEDAIAFAERLAAVPPLGVRWTKQGINRLTKNVMAAAFDAGMGYQLVTILSGGNF